MTTTGAIYIVIRVRATFGFFSLSWHGFWFFVSLVEAHVVLFQGRGAPGSTVATGAAGALARSHGDAFSAPAR